MNDKAVRGALAEDIAGLLAECRAAREQITCDGALRPPFAALARWQTARLGHTHQDFLASPRYRPAASFVFSDLYGDRDYSPRDQDLERVYPLMVRLMPAGALDSIILALETHALTQTLDIAIVQKLDSEAGDQLPINAARYAAAYRACDNAALRRRQIELVVATGKLLDQVVDQPLIYSLIRLTHGPAHMAGLGALHDFLESGFKAFRHMRGATEFLNIIRERELQVMEQILAGAPTQRWAPEELP